MRCCTRARLRQLVGVSEESTVSVRIQAVFYSMYGHIYRMSEAVVEGAREVEGAEVSLYQVAELVPEEALEKIGAKAARSAFGHVPIATPGQLAEADAIKGVSRLAFGLHVGMKAGCPGGDHFCCFRNILGRAEEEQRQARHGTVQLVIGAETRCT